MNVALSYALPALSTRQIGEWSPCIPSTVPPLSTFTIEINCPLFIDNTFRGVRVLLGLCCTGYYKLSVKQNTNGTLLICIYSRICRKWIDKRTYRFYLFLLYLIIFLNNIFSHFFVILIKFSSFFHMKKEKFSIIFYNVIKWRTVFWCIVPEDLSLFQQFLLYFRNGNLMTLWLPARIVANKIVTHFKFLQFV